MVKRALDIFAAALLLALTLPLLAVAAVLIKLDSDGPVIFCQDRVGRGFNRFRLFKLRTMNLRGVGTAYTLGADPRITRVGRWLRYYKIDELPQLWNVLRGEMSMVGPRPVIPELAAEFEWGYVRLLAVRPGLTDPASLKYCNEANLLETLTDADRYFKRVITPDKVRISLEYMQRANLWTDLILMAQTALALVSPEFRTRVVRPARAQRDRAELSIVPPMEGPRRRKTDFNKLPDNPKGTVPFRVVDQPTLVQRVSKDNRIQA